MEDVLFKEEIMKNAIKTINNKQSFLNKLFNFFKYLLSLIGIKNIFIKKIIFETIKVRYNEHIFFTPIPIEMEIKDDCLLLNGFIVPYEYLISLKRYKSENSNLYTIDVLGKIIVEEDRLRISLGNEYLKLLFYTNDKYNLLTHISNNMYYHIKYNKINDQVIFDINKKNK